MARRRCLREAERILQSRSEAEDAVQEAFLRAWRQWPKCRTPDAPTPWLLQITRNEALRLRGHRASRMQGELSDEPGLEDPRLAQANARVDLDRALDGLSAEDRRLIELRYSQDLTQPVVAARLGIPEGTVKVRLHRLRSRLRGALEVHA